MIETDHELKIHRIPTNTPQKFTSNRSPRDHCIENQKRERKPSSYCLRTRRSMVDYSRIIGEAPMRMMNPSVMVLDWISRFWNFGGWMCFSSTPLGFLEYWGIYRAERRWRGVPRRAQPIRERPGPLVSPGALWSPRSSSLVLLWPNGCLLAQKISKKFRGVWASFGTDILRSKK